jgi:hypothetical protein
MKRCLLAGFRASANEYKAIRMRARRIGLTPSAYMRLKCLEDTPLPQYLKDEGLRKDMLREVEILKKSLSNLELRLNYSNQV